MLFNTTFNNISVISWWSVLLVEETRVPRENHLPAASQTNFYHILLYRVHLAWAGFELTTLVMIGTDCIGSYKSNYHTITKTTPSIYTQATNVLVYMDNISSFKNHKFFIKNYILSYVPSIQENVWKCSY